MENKYIINADDYGLTESCSKAIAEAFEKIFEFVSISVKRINELIR